MRKNSTAAGILDTFQDNMGLLNRAVSGLVRKGILVTALFGSVQFANAQSDGRVDVSHCNAYGAVLDIAGNSGGNAGPEGSGVVFRRTRNIDNDSTKKAQDAQESMIARTTDIVRDSLGNKVRGDDGEFVRVTNPKKLENYNQQMARRNGQTPSINSSEPAEELLAQADTNNVVADSNTYVMEIPEFIAVPDTVRLPCHQNKPAVVKYKQPAKDHTMAKASNQTSRAANPSGGVKVVKAKAVSTDATAQAAAAKRSETVMAQFQETRQQAIDPTCNCPIEIGTKMVPNPAYQGAAGAALAATLNPYGR